MTREFYFRIRQSMIVVAAVISAVAHGAAQDADLQSCADVADDAERLMCYDAMIERQHVSSGAPAPDGQSAGFGEISAVEMKKQPDKGPAEMQSEMAEADVAPSRRQHKPSTSKSDRRYEYTATVEAIRKRPHGQMVVTLDNGEVWSEQFASRAFLVKVGDTITMKRGRFSRSYRLVAPGGRGYKMTLLDQ